MKIPFQNFSAVHSPYRQDLIDSFSRVLDSEWYILGSEVKAFENEFSQYLGVKESIGVANGLEALQISLMALGIGKGDEVITTPLSAVATTLAILAVGATPIFVDVDSNGLITAQEIEKVINKRTKAVLPVHLYGASLDIYAIKALCEKHKLYLVEDAAQAQGTRISGVNVGTLGTLGCFSFYPTKNLGALGDAGAIVTNVPALAAVCRQIRDYGQESKYRHTQIGLNSRLDELQAALLRVKLRSLEKENTQRRKIAELYRKALSSVPGVSLLNYDANGEPNYHLFVIKSSKRDQLQAFLKKEGVETLVHYPISIPDQPVFDELYRDANIPMCRAMCDEVLSLPCNPSMGKVEVEIVCEKIDHFYG